MNIRKIWNNRDVDYEVVWQTIFSRVQQGDKVEPAEIWSTAISFPHPSGLIGYLPIRGNVILGILPFYKLLYVPIAFGINDENEFRQTYGIDTRYFLDLVEAGKVVPIFPATSDLYSDFVADEIWSYLEVRRLSHLLAWQINALCVAFQSVSGVMLPWSEPNKDPWWTEMMIKASALDGRLIADFPSDPAKFSASRTDFDKLPSEIKSYTGLLDAEKLAFIARTLSISFSNRISPSNYVEILNNKITRTLQLLFESTAKIEEAGGKTILELCKEYNDQIEDLSKSKAYKLSKLISDLFTKHILAISLGVVAGALVSPLPGLVGLIVGEVAQKLSATAKSKIGKATALGAQSLTSMIARWLGKDSDLVHLCLAREALRKK
jgi:hypothetical protein